MREAYRRIHKDAAVGVDGVTAAHYEAELEANLTGLLERFKSGRYRAPAVRRVHLEKPGTSKTRPIGIPTLEDKILQRAVLMVLEPVYEQDFLDCSYGFRPGRGAHQALDALWQGLMKLGGGWVIDLDIEDFFGSVDWGHLRSFLDRRVRDGVIRRAIGKWLNAGVMDPRSHDPGRPSAPSRHCPARLRECDASEEWPFLSREKCKENKQLFDRSRNGGRRAFAAVNCAVGEIGGARSAINCARPDCCHHATRPIGSRR